MMAWLRRWGAKHDPGVPLRGMLFFSVCRDITVLTLMFLYRLRVVRQKTKLPDGPILIVSNHQSFWDPSIVGAAVRPRCFASMAKSGLFGNKLFGGLIHLLNAIPIKQGESDLSAMKKAIAQLEKGRMVMIYPEGERSWDGAMGECKRGTWLLISRAKCPVLPIGFDGAHDAWPRTSKWPKLFKKRIAVCVGEPIAYDTLKAMKATEGMAFLESQIDMLRLRSRAMLRRETDGRYPAAGPGDLPAQGVVNAAADSDAPVVN